MAFPTRVVTDAGVRGVTGLRVAFLNPSLYAIGGMQAWLAGLMPALRERGWEPWLALPTGPHNDAEAYLRNYPWSPRVLVANPTCSALGRVRGVQRALRDARPDVLVVANIVTAYRAVSDLRAKGCRTPRVVACVHTLDEGIFTDLSRYRGVIDALAAPNRLIARAGTEISGLAPERVFQAPYCVDEGRAAEADEKGPGLTLVFAHRLDHHQKRALDLVPLVEELERRGVTTKLEIAGEGEELPALRRAFASRIAAGAVRFLGAVPPAEFARAVLKPGRVLLVLSSWEMGPIVAWQAMLRGTVVASSRYLGSGAEAFLRDGENAVCFPVGRMDLAAEAIGRLADAEFRREIAERARAGAAARFSKEASASAWDEGLRRALELPEQPRPGRTTEFRAAGRLDRMLGVRGAELIRRAFGLRVRTSGPGDEWPHTEGGGMGREEFFRKLEALDREGEAPDA